MDPKKYHHGDLKRTLLKVADIELAKNGPNGLSLREIAKQAGVSHTAPYKHFKDKDQLLKEMVAHEFKNLIQFAEEVEWRYPDNVEMQFRAFAEKFLNLAETTPRKLVLMLSEIATYQNEIKENLYRLVVGDSENQKLSVERYWLALMGAVLIASQEGIKSESAEVLAEQLASIISYSLRSL